jgi:hypothetical protein
MVCGEIGEKPLVGCEGAAPVDPAALPATSKGFAAGWPAAGADDFWDDSDCRISTMDDTAPTAGNMIKLRQGR